ncbi:DUF3261 domain-containing protein [Thermomonas carbonis]|uniref:DUF3261 domain-containing protein n=1 Tax=Thermomonas carbonis TaxID=1463158 RepID=A0A7G9SP48_9GAMM|nr:DUF3261 domain-containing protein [Thermomonas carbonis]QNN69623.1 DUF3261 domain-containing protein [Thermomonas carbonis]GHB94369.1 hypothetical protein GCM10010080_01910 [Thermomonas carbonis]
MRRLIGLLLSALLLAGCVAQQAAVAERKALAASMPMLRLPPSALPGTLALQQRLAFRHGDRRETVDALVENDTGSTRLVIHAQGQVALRLEWDGKQLTQTRAPWLPSELDGERVLSDLQLVFWPVDAIASALPEGWSLRDDQGQRVLRQRETIIATVEYPQPMQARLDQRALGYMLEISSSEIESMEDTP